MNKIKLLIIAVLAAGLSACATPARDIGLLDSRIAEVTDGDYGQFLHHQSLAEENLAYMRKVRQYWKDDHYWNIDLNTEAMAAGDRAMQHRRDAEAALIRWHDNCTRHHELCDRMEGLELLHTKRLYSAAFFDTESAVPKSLREESIAAVMDIAKRYPSLIIDVIGYTDTMGTVGFNKRLAGKRADAVSEALRSRGLPATVRLQAIPIGEAGGPDNTPSAENRRVDIDLHHGGSHHQHK